MIQKPIINIYKNTDQLAKHLAIDLADYLKRLSREKESIYIAISGGSTPSLLFKEIVDAKIEFPWAQIRIFWVDERCVAPDHSESNFGVAHAQLLEPMNVPNESVFRIHGENDPVLEARRYSDLIMDTVSPEMLFPVFDLVLLGLGEDGHTASIFPDEIELWNAEELCTIGTHPLTGQLRVTFTGHLINAAKKVLFLAAGDNKSDVVTELINRTGNFRKYPASNVNPHHGMVNWYLDSEAAKGIM